MRNKTNPGALRAQPGSGTLLDGGVLNTTACAKPLVGDLPWGEQQLDALDKIEDWLGRPTKPFFYLGGFAGTGKTSLLRGVREIAGDRVLYAAPTGRAASVMRRKGCADATTLHRLIYRSPFTWTCQRGCAAPPCAELCAFARQEWLGRQLDPDSEVRDADLVIIDEASMVDRTTALDLLSFEVPVLVVGDPGQLPPIAGPGYFTARPPDAMLTEIHRQAAGNPIIELATMARAGRAPPVGLYGDSEVIRAADFDGDPTSYDAVVCGTHRLRRELNHYLRQLLGFTGSLPMVGEKLLILRNRHEKSLCNGDIVTVIAVGEERRGFLPLNVVTDDRRKVRLNTPVDLLVNDDANASGAQGDPAVFGYAITCHKAQGCEWRDVLVFDESWSFRENRARWLYTAITRASQRVTLVTGVPS